MHSLPRGCKTQTIFAHDSIHAAAAAYLGVAAEHELGLEEAGQGDDGHSGCDDEGHLPTGNEGNDVSHDERHQVLCQQAQLISNRTTNSGCVHRQPTCQGATLVLLAIKPASFLQARIGKQDESGPE